MLSAQLYGLNFPVYHLFIVNNHVWFEFRNNDISLEGTSSGREATDIAIQQEVNEEKKSMN